MLKSFVPHDCSQVLQMGSHKCDRLLLTSKSDENLQILGREECLTQAFRRRPVGELELGSTIGTEGQMIFAVFTPCRFKKLWGLEVVVPVIQAERHLIAAYLTDHFIIVVGVEIA